MLSVNHWNSPLSSEEINGFCITCSNPACNLARLRLCLVTPCAHEHNVLCMGKKKSVIFLIFQPQRMCSSSPLAVFQGGARLFIFGSHVKALIISTGSCKRDLCSIINHNKPVLNAARLINHSNRVVSDVLQFNRRLLLGVSSLFASLCPLPASARRRRLRRRRPPTTTARFSPGSWTGSWTDTTTGSGRGSEVLTRLILASQKQNQSLLMCK